MLQVIIHLVFLLNMINVVWVLRPPPFSYKGNFSLMVVILSSQSKNYPDTINSNKDSPSSSLSQRWYGHFSGDGKGKGSAGPRTTHLFYCKLNFGTDRNDGEFQPYQNHCIAPPVVSSLSKYYSVGATDSSSFGVIAGDGKGGVGNSTTNLTPQNIYF